MNQTNQVKKRTYKQPRQYLASSSVLLDTESTKLIQNDIFNEPNRFRIDQTGAKWVRFFTQDGAFLKNLIAIVNNSPTLRRIIEDKTNMVVGDGFIPVQGRANSLITTNNSISQLNISSSVLDELELALSDVNAHGQNLQEVLSAIAFDFFAFGNCFVEMVKATVANEEFTYIYHVPIYQVAVKKAGANQLIDHYGIYDYWEEIPLGSDGKAYEKKGFRAIPKYPVFEEYTDQAGNITQRSIIHLKQYAPGYFYFGLPEWIGAKMWAEIEYRIQRFNTSKFENGFMPSGLLQLFGSMPQQAANELINAIESEFTGTGNNHKIFSQVIRDPALKANWVPMSTEQKGEFLELQQLAASAIVIACRWSKSLAGFATEGQLGTNQQIRQEMEYLQNTVIKPKQNLFLSQIINPYLQEVAKSNTALAGIQLNISNSLPVSFMGDLNIEANLTTDEKREVLGYAPLNNTNVANTTA